MLIYHNLLEKQGMTIEEAFTNWLMRLNGFPDDPVESLCEYINDKLWLTGHGAAASHKGLMKILQENE
jgi:hypothetical protein